MRKARIPSISKIYDTDRNHPDRCDRNSMMCGGTGHLVILRSISKIPFGYFSTPQCGFHETKKNFIATPKMAPPLMSDPLDISQNAVNVQC